MSGLGLVALDCASCGSALTGGPDDSLFLCTHCGAGAILGEDGLREVPGGALMPVPGRTPTTWRPAWLFEVDARVHDRVRAGGRPTEGWSSRRTLIVPAFDLPLADLTRLMRALAAVETPVELPREPVAGGTLHLDDALTLIRHLLVGDEVRRPDMLASVEVDLDLVEHRLVAHPFESARDGRLRCAVTGVTVSEGR